MTFCITLQNNEFLPDPLLHISPLSLSLGLSFSSPLLPPPPLAIDLRCSFVFLLCFLLLGLFSPPLILLWRHERTAQVPAWQYGT